MRLRKTTTGERFDLDKTEELTRIDFDSHQDIYGSNLQVTASGVFIVENWSRQQGEKTTYEKKTKEEAFEILLLEEKLSNEVKEKYFKELKEDDFVDI